eukprot:EG_transcript_17733
MSWHMAAVDNPEPAETGTARLIDGKALAAAVLARVAAEVRAMGGPAPRLAVVNVGDNPASLSYIRNKEKAATSCGMKCDIHQLPADTAEAEVLALIDRLNADESVSGIIVQLPVPRHLNPITLTERVAEVKDVDGLTAANMGRVAMNGHVPTLAACTPLGCIEMLKSLGITLRGKDAVVIGASNLFGLPMMLMLLKEGCTVTICHIDTKDCAGHASRADILIVGVGVVGLVRKEWVKPGAVVIDVGTNVIPDPTRRSGRRLVGDVAFDEVSRVAGWITPVPGGVGPMTVAMLMRNTLKA